MRDSSGTADANGVVQVKAATGDDALPQVKLERAELPAGKTRTAGGRPSALKANESVWPFSSHPETVVVTMELYHGPDPAIDLLVPPGYRGQIKVDVRVREDVAYQPGLREFQGTVPPDGMVQIEGPPILRHGRGPTFFAHYLDEAHTQVPTEVGPDEVGFRWVRTEGRTEIFVIGTKSEYEKYRRAGDKGSSSTSDSSSGKSGGGKGGGGRRRRRMSDIDSVQVVWRTGAMEPK